jgi:hypothetical protein
MLHFQRSSRRWWQKPLAIVDGRDLPAELAVLRGELRDGETGVWLNSRGLDSGTVDLTADGAGFKTVRRPLPEFVSAMLRSIYSNSGLVKGAPDLVLWNEPTGAIRFVEVKCPDWDRPSRGQLVFHQAAKAAGCPVKVIEWRFRPDEDRADA